MRPHPREWIGAGVPPGLQSRLGFVNSGAGGFDSHALPPQLCPRRDLSPLRPGSRNDHALALRDTITIRKYQPGDEQAILATFNRVFACDDANFEARTLEHWRWLYADNPLGARIVVAVDCENEVLAQYAGLAVRAKLEGRDTLFCQAVDSINARSERTGLARRGLFAACCESFRDAFGGDGEGKYAFAYGLPVGAPWRIGTKQLGYQLMREGLVLDLDLGRAPEASEDFAADVTVREVERFDAEVDELFARVSTEHAAIVVRDASYLNWRFADSPTRRYSLAVAGSKGSARGLAVYGFGRFEGVVGGLVCDWLTPSDDVDAARALRAWLLAKARASQASRLLAVFGPESREWLDFQHAGFRVRRASHLWAGFSHVRSQPVRWFGRHFYTTLGDTDLV